MFPRRFRFQRRRLIGVVEMRFRLSWSWPKFARAVVFVDADFRSSALIVDDGKRDYWRWRFLDRLIGGSIEDEEFLFFYRTSIRFGWIDAGVFIFIRFEPSTKHWSLIGFRWRPHFFFPSTKNLIFFWDELLNRLNRAPTGLKNELDWRDWLTLPCVTYFTLMLNADWSKN